MDWKKMIPHAVAVLVMALVALLFCSPVLKGKVLVQDDIVKNIAQAKEARDYREANGEEALWTTRVFSGMTMFHIGTQFATNVTQYFRGAITGWLPKTVDKIFAIFFGFYILLVFLGVNPWLALVMAMAYGLSSNLIVSLLAGHNTKVLSIAFLAPALAGIVLGLNGKRVIGAFLTLLFVGMMIVSNHYQIMYYFLLMAMVIGAVYIYYAIREKTLPDTMKNIGILAIAAILALLPNLGKVYNTYEHSKETIRAGESELDTKKAEDKGGLDRSYAMRWSYAPMETFTIVIPSFMGGATGEALPEKGHVEEALKQFNLTRQQKEGILAQGPMYIGDQPFLLGTVYFGAGFVFLFLLAIFLLKGRTRAWVLGVVILSLIISWGRHIEFITGFLFDYFPMYNKFRTPSMALAIAGIAIPMAGVLGLHRLFSGEIDKAEFQQSFRLALYTAGGLMILLLLYGLLNDWVGAKDAQYQTKNSPWGIDAIYDALIADRKSRYLSDWLMSTLIMAVTAGVIWYYKKSKLKFTAAIAVLGIVYVGDMWRVSKRYMNEDSFVPKREYEAKFSPTPADQAILQDKDPHFRVVNITRNPWTDGLTCYHHENVGGHHAAKLQRYQDLIEHGLSSQLQLLNKGLSQNDRGIFLNPQIASQMPVYNMLNARYYIVQGSTPQGAVRNPKACGNAWFVSNIEKAASSEDEINALEAFDPLSTAIVHEEFSDDIYNYSFDKSEDARILLEEQSPKYLRYSTRNKRDGLAVFSEVYYTNGWKAFIDGQPTEIYRVNYVLRAMKIPQGEHTVEMRFEPASYSTGMTISLAGSALFLLFAGGMLYFHLKKRQE